MPPVQHPALLLAQVRLPHQALDLVLLLVLDLALALDQLRVPWRVRLRVIRLLAMDRALFQVPDRVLLQVPDRVLLQVP